LVDKLTIIMVAATIIGARLGHVLFYEPEKYLSNPLEILKVWEGGLASHGAAIVILLSLWFYSKRTPNQNYLWVLDRIAIVTAMTGALIRLGNLMNSEIGGKDTGTDSGFVYAWDAEEILQSLKIPVESIEAYKPDDRQNELQGNGIVPVNFDITISKGSYSIEDLKSTLERDVKYAFTKFNSSKLYLAEPLETPLNFKVTDKGDQYIATIMTYGRTKYPTQIYESVSYLLIFIGLFAIWYKYTYRVPEGLLVGLFMIFVFGTRFYWEFFKETQVDFEKEMSLNMGQLLSIPLVTGGIILVIFALKKGLKPINT
jgi:phosphatidylglycerol---prolipoprotein diacylglyceryl transferase